MYNYSRLILYQRVGGTRTVDVHRGLPVDGVRSHFPVSRHTRTVEERGRWERGLWLLQS